MANHNYSKYEDPEILMEQIQRANIFCNEALINYNNLLNANINYSVCDINDADLVFQEKCKMIAEAEKCFEVIDGMSVAKTQSFALLYDFVTKENQEKNELKHLLIEEINSKIKLLKEKEEILRVLQEIPKSLDKNEIEYIDFLNTLDIDTKTEFKKMRNALHHILENCYNKLSFKTLIQDLTAAYLNGGDDKYIDISDGYLFSDIEVLKQASLVVEDPYDKMRIKFDDFK